MEEYFQYNGFREQEMKNNRASKQKNISVGAGNSSGGSELNPEIVEKSKNSRKRHKRKMGVYYSFLTFVLLFCLIQVGAGLILNISKTISYHGKIKKMRKVLDDAEQRNKDLKTDISLFSKTSTLEELARNNLKMTGDNEVLIIINSNVPSTTPATNSTNKKHTKR